MLSRGSASATFVLLAALSIAPPVGAASEATGDNPCVTTVLFGYDELVIAPILSDAVGVVVGTSVTANGAGVTLLVRPHACGVPDPIAPTGGGMSKLAQAGGSSAPSPELPVLPMLP